MKVLKSDVELYRKFQQSPIFFIEKMWGLSPQTEKFIKGKHLTFQQVEILKAVEDAINDRGLKRISIRSGHGIGKSTTFAFLILWYLFCFKDAQIPCTAPTSDQMHDVLWKEVAKWLQKMPDIIKDKYEWTTNYIRIKESPETWFARAKTARKENPEALAGVHGDYVLFLIDEASGVPEEIFNTAEGALTEQNIIVVMISNPTRTIGYFYDSFHSDSDNWKTLHFSSLDSPIVEDGYVERIKEKHGEDSDEYRIRVKGEFPDVEGMDDKGYVPLYKESDIKIIEPGEFIGRVLLGVDPAGSGKNKTVWVARDQFRAKVVATENISDPKSIARRTITLMDWLAVKPEDTAIDSFGTGADAIQEIALMGRRVKGVNVGDRNVPEEFLNLRAQAYWKVKQWFRRGGEIEDHKGWDELLYIRFRKELSGKMQIMPKKEMQKEGYKSPDHADALMLTFTISEKTKQKRRVYKPKNKLLGI